MTRFAKGDVVLLPFDFTDGTGFKWRPAIIVSTGRYCSESPDVLVASITSNLNARPHPGDVILQNWEAAGLLRPSLAQTKIATVEAGQVGRKLGRLSESDLAQVDDGLRLALGL